MILQIYQWLRSHVGVANFFDDGLSWTLLRCNHEEQKVHSAQRIALMAECNTKLAVSLTLMDECFVPMVDPRTSIDMIPHVMYNRGYVSQAVYHIFFPSVSEWIVDRLLTWRLKMLP
jgi:hypothetical protein